MRIHLKSVVVLFGLLAIVPRLGLAAESDFDKIFRAAKEAPVGNTIIVESPPGVVLVISGNHEYALDGKDLLIQADELRIAGKTTIRAYDKPAEPTGGTPSAAGVGNPDHVKGAADPSNEGGPGGVGPPGATGVQGKKGAPAGFVRIECKSVTGDGLLTVENVGQQGGKGQKGGQGGTGGHGQKGGQGVSTLTDCSKGAGKGGVGGQGGPGGTGGQGGDGGPSGEVVLACAAGQSQVRNRLMVSVAQSNGGDGGDPGNVGAGGIHGDPGDGDGHCHGGNPGEDGHPGDPGGRGPGGPKGASGRITTLSCQTQ